MNRPMAKPTPELLRNVPLFSALDDADLESLAEEFNERRFSAGDKIALEGEGGLMFFVVESGEATVEVHGEEVAKLGPGAHFGEIALIDRRPRTATVTATTDLRTFGLPVFVFRPFVEARPQVAWKLLEAMADRLAAAESARLAQDRNPLTRSRSRQTLKASASRPRRYGIVTTASRGRAPPDRLRPRGSPDSATASAPGISARTRPPKTTQRTPAAAARRATSPGALPSAVVRSTCPPR